MVVCKGAMVKKKKMVIEYKYAQGAIGGFSAGVVYKPKSQKELPLRISGKKYLVIEILSTTAKPKPKSSTLPNGFE